MTGNPYVFISYAHLDSASVLPCVDAMKKSGINLWYDEGIEAGSEWPEFIAEKVVSCSKFVLFISNAYLNSQNCKRELNFAISRKKDILSIFMEDVDLSPGMEMQLGTYQAIYRNRFATAESFRKSLASETYFNTCRTGQTPPQSYTTTNTGGAQNFGTPPYTPPKTSPSSSSSSSSSSTYSRPTSAPKTTATNAMPAKNRVVAALLAIFLGFIGIHKFYLKQPIRGILYLIFCSTYVPAILSFIEGIRILCSTDEKFAHKYKCRIKQ